MSDNKEFLEYLKKETRKLVVIKEGDFGISKTDLVNWGKEVGIDLKGETRLMITKELLGRGFEYLDFYNRYKYKAYGINTSIICRRFRINNNQLRKMIDDGFLKVEYYKNDKMNNGKVIRKIFINAENYFDLTINKIECWKSLNINMYKIRR